MWTREDFTGGEIDFFHLCLSWFSQFSLFSGHITCMWMKNVQLSDKNGQTSLDYTFQSCRELGSVQILVLPLKQALVKHTRRFAFTTVCWTARLTNWSKLAAGVRKPPAFFFPGGFIPSSLISSSLSLLCALWRGRSSEPKRRLTVMSSLKLLEGNRRAEHEQNSTAAAETAQQKNSALIHRFTFVARTWSLSEAVWAPAS